MRLVLRWLDSPWAFELLPGLNKLGRNPTNDFRISDPSVSSFHAEITLENDLVRVQDLGSTNGSFINDIKVTESELKPEHILRLGNVRLALQDVSAAPVAKVPIAEPVPVPAEPSAATAPVDLTPACAYHSDKRAAYRCEKCGGCFCLECTTVVGQGRFAATTVCPVCKGQCYALPSHSPDRQRQGLLGRLTQTLKLPFSR